MNWDPWYFGKSLNDIFSSFKFDKNYVDSYTTSFGWALPTSTPNALREILAGMNFSEQPATALDGSNLPTFSTFYHSYFKHLDEVYWHPFLWHKRFSLRYSSYAWLALVGKLKTADHLRLRGIDVLAGCSFCDSGIECNSHLFFCM
ncbi:hypothetical protein KFK09_014035 [Dendrobium nobile]|uniref:Reverse transcriptase zinc-binding domain-containing protein n=1 Tax=Dendrobium nobile TaxID=94219 RepID=A0A8T3B921_DENNO|nr:hypothetical protein KFK09_014035 [Dendrobium nobile]